MDEAAEVIRDRMEEKREALTEKLEALEDQVVGTVQTAASTVADTVETVKESVKGTVDTVKESVEEVVTSVKETLDVRQQFERHPWPMFAGSVAVGFLAERLLGGTNSSRTSVPWESSNGHAYGNGAAGAQFQKETPAAPMAPGPLASVNGDSFLQQLNCAWRHELSAARALGLGVAAGLVRDFIVESIPAELGSRVSELIDDFTQRVGAKPLAGPILKKPVADSNNVQIARTTRLAASL